MIPLQTKIVSTLEDLKSCKPEWNDAVSNSISDSVFLTYEWVTSWIQYFAGGQPLCFVVSKRDQRIIGILPFLQERRRIFGTDYNVLRSPSNSHTNQYNFIIESNGRAEILEHMIHFISRNTDWDLMELDFVPDNAQLIPLLRRLEKKSYYKFNLELLMESPYVAISGSWNDYLQKRDKKVRRNFDYFEKKLKKEGKVEILKISAGDDLKSHVMDAFEIEKRSWKGDAGTAIADSENEKGFYTELAQKMSEKGMFSLYFLAFNGEKIAFDYCLEYNDHFYVLKTGYNPEYGKYSPGRVLMINLLRDIHRTGQFSYYDFLGAAEKWKYEWTDSAQRICRITLFNKKPASIFLCNATLAGEVVKRSIKRYPFAYQLLKQTRNAFLTRRLRN